MLFHLVLSDVRENFTEDFNKYNLFRIEIGHTELTVENLKKIKIIGDRKESSRCPKFCTVLFSCLSAESKRRGKEGRKKERRRRIRKAQQQFVGRKSCGPGGSSYIGSLALPRINFHRSTLRLILYFVYEEPISLLSLSLSHSMLFSCRNPFRLMARAHSGQFSVQ